MAFLHVIQHKNIVSTTVVAVGNNSSPAELPSSSGLVAPSAAWLSMGAGEAPIKLSALLLARYWPASSHTASQPSRG